MSPTLTVENLMPVIDALASHLKSSVGLDIDPIKGEMIQKLMTRDRIYRKRSPGGDFSDLYVLFWKDSPTALLYLGRGKMDAKLSQRMTSVMVTAWYATVGETRRHRLARAAVEALCVHFESPMTGLISTEHREDMVNAMVTTMMVHIPLPSLGTKTLMLINVEGMPTAIIYTPDRYLEFESEAAQAVINSVLLGAW